MATNYADVVYARLNEATLTALVGTRITPSKPTQEPGGDFLCFWRDSGEEGLNLDGAMACRWINIRVECVSGTQAGAEAILNAARARLHGWRDLTVGVQVCAAQGDATEETLPDGRQISGQSFMLRWKPV